MTEAEVSEQAQGSMGSPARPLLTGLAAVTTGLLRISLGLVSLWAFVEQALGVAPTNTDGATAPSYGWHFGYNSSLG